MHAGWGRSVGSSVKCLFQTPHDSCLGCCRCFRCCNRRCCPSDLPPCTGWLAVPQVNNISIDSCVKTGVMFEDVIASCEVVNSKVTPQGRGKVTID